MAANENDNGVWRTVCGRKIFIKKGQSLTDAMRESGKFKKTATVEKKAPKNSSSKVAVSKEFGKSNCEEFSSAVKKAKESVPPDKAWRVTAHTQDELNKEYPGAKLHVTEGGSTVAVTKDGDIVSVCKSDGDRETRGRDLLALAIKNGGKKLDSYAGNHTFYIKCGFEPVSWCEWNDDYAPEGWSESGCEREPIVFYRFTGKKSSERVEEFCENVKASKDYDAAQKSRDELL